MLQLILHPAQLCLHASLLLVGWILLAASPGGAGAHTQYYRSQSLISPDGRYAAYSRIQM